MRKELTRTEKIISQTLNSFSSITQNRLIFANSSIIIIDNNVISDFDNLASYFPAPPFSAFAAFPLIIKRRLAGFFIMDIAKTDESNLKMCGNYIESSLRFIDQERSQEIQLLDPLTMKTVKRLTTILNSNLFISDSQRQALALPSIHLNQKEKNEKPLNDIDKHISMALKYINGNLDKSLSLKSVANQIYVSPSYLSRIFKNNFQDNFINYINLQKIALMQKELVFTKIPVDDLIRQIGFIQTSYFAKIFKNHVGVSPSKYRKYNTGISKIYTIPRSLSWRDDNSVYDASKDFFRKNNISFKTRNTLGYPYIYSINDLDDIKDHAGWVYTVDCAQVEIPANKIHVNDKSVIQWIYLKIH